jgi:hypothetical protein
MYPESNKNTEVANEIIEWFENYASVYEFDTRIQFEEFTKEDLESCDVETVWSLVLPKVKALVALYLEAGIEDHDDE